MSPPAPATTNRKRVRLSWSSCFYTPFVGHHQGNRWVHRSVAVPRGERWNVPLTSTRRSSSGSGRRSLEPKTGVRTPSAGPSPLRFCFRRSLRLIPIRAFAVRANSWLVLRVAWHPLMFTPTAPITPNSYFHLRGTHLAAILL